MTTITIIIIIIIIIMITIIISITIIIIIIIIINDGLTSAMVCLHDPHGEMKESLRLLYEKQWEQTTSTLVSNPHLVV